MAGIKLSFTDNDVKVIQPGERDKPNCLGINCKHFKLVEHPEFDIKQFWCTKAEQPVFTLFDTTGCPEHKWLRGNQDDPCETIQVGIYSNRKRRRQQNRYEK